MFIKKDKKRSQERGGETKRQALGSKYQSTVKSHYV